MKKMNAYWVDYLNAYRLYDPNRPWETIAYDDNLDEATERLKEFDYVLDHID